VSQQAGRSDFELRLVWLPDDDLKADLTTLNRFFEIVSEYDLDLAQPALGAGSYVAHDITLRRPRMRLRFTTFVEIMAACFSRRALELCQPYLGATISSWGPNHFFLRLLGYPDRKIAIIDETSVIHTRPPHRGPNSALAVSQGASPQDELNQFLQMHGLEPRFETFGAIDRKGNFVRDLSEIDRHKAHWRSFNGDSSVRQMLNPRRLVRGLKRLFSLAQR